MGSIVGGFASSHAFTFLEPAAWEGFRQTNRASFARRYGTLPREDPHVLDEPLHEASRRFDRIRDGLGHVRAAIAAAQIDALIVIGDDQNENFDASALPQIAVHTGEQFTVAARFLDATPTWAGAAELAGDIVVHTVENGFDVTVVSEFRDNTLRSHAHGEIVANVLAGTGIPVVPVFLNAIHAPALAPERCYRLGQAIADAVRCRRPVEERVAVYASGGLSHFTAGYPWRSYNGSRAHGDICEAFDRRALELLETGTGQGLSTLTSQDLIESGNIELRAWICAAGATAGADLRWRSVYEPIPRAIMGMAVGWTEPPASNDDRR